MPAPCRSCQYPANTNVYPVWTVIILMAFFNITSSLSWPDAGTFYCNGSCYPVSCEVVALLNLAPRLLLSTAATAAIGTSTSLNLPYGIEVGFGLLPCTSSGMQDYPAVSGMHDYFVLTCTLQTNIVYSRKRPEATSLFVRCLFSCSLQC